MEFYEALGLGLDVRILAKTVWGDVLVEGSRVQHLCAFRATEDSFGNGCWSRAWSRVPGEGNGNVEFFWDVACAERMRAYTLKGQAQMDNG